MANNETMAKISIWVHLLIMISLVWVPFFIPLSIWPKRPLWHFIFLIAIMVLGVITAMVYRIRYNSRNYFICSLNLITQRIRGYKYSDKRNYNYSHLKEILQFFKIKIPTGFSPKVLMVTTFITLINFILYLF